MTAIRDLLSYRLHLVANLLSRGAELRYRREFGVSLWEWRTIALLGAATEPLSLNHLAHAAGIHKSQMSRVVSGLAKRRIVTREPDPGDARGVRLALSRTGRRLYDGLISAAAERGVHGLPVGEGKAGVRPRARQARHAGQGFHSTGKKLKTRITELLGIEHPIFQAAMSWASSNSALVIAVSNAGGMGVLAAGPLRPEDFKRILGEIKNGTRKPFGVNIPLNGARGPELLEIAFQQKIPVMVASQGGPREHLARFRGIGTKWLHVVASVEHAKKAEAAGVDALVVDGAEAGGHPPPSEVGTLVLVRRVLQAVKLPVVASGGVADGAGVAALLALGAEAVQLGTRFIATPEASVHDNYKRAVLDAEVDQTTLVGRGMHPIRLLKNAFSAKYEAAERAGASRDELETLFQEYSLKQAALRGDIEWGKVEAGQSAGLVHEILPAAEVMRRLVNELEAARQRLAKL
jgi:enoyl-[acyl-carrier protein] reductase II